MEQEQEQEYELQPQPAKTRNLYFAGLAVFIAASLVLTVWAYIDLAVAQ